jgi:MFS family permease
VLVLSVFLGLINAVDIPTRQAFVIEMLEKKEDLGNAIALNSSMFNAARLIGPTIAGLTIGFFGEGVCFLLNGLSYLAVILALGSMKIQKQKKVTPDTHPFQGLAEGFRYAVGFPPIKGLLLLVASISLLGVPYAVLMPVFARDIFHGGPHTLGFLMGATGIGALGGAIFLASRKHVQGLEKMIPRSAALFGFGLILLSFTPDFRFGVPVLVGTGFGIIVALASCNIVLQTIVDDDKRGRIMSFYAMAFMGMAPLGSLMVGAMAGKIGAPSAVRIGGSLCILAAGIFATKLESIRQMIHPIYVQKGILPEVASGIQTASELTSHPKE